MRRYIWLSVIMLGIWSVSGCSRNDIVSPSVQSAGPVERDEGILAEYWDIRGIVINNMGQPVPNAPVSIMVHHVLRDGRDSTAYFLVFTDENGAYILDDSIVRVYSPTVRVKLSCIQSEPPEVILDKPDGWNGDYYSVVNFRINLPYCVPIME